jgi:hypothetical protein
MSSQGKPEKPSATKPVCVLGLDESGAARGIFKDERIHVAVVGFPGTGKTRFLLSLALQNVADGDGLLLMDPHGDLAKIFLSHIPRSRWDDVIYIDPLTAKNYGRVVKVNFLECPDPKDRDVVARSFMESLEKIYARYWGPRLDMILMNAVYTLLDAGNTNLSNLYRVIADEQFREQLLQEGSDEKVRSFWDSEFKRMPRDASSAALTKIYRIVQERIVAPVFDCAESNVDFREVMDKGKIVVVNLSEGAITSDVANFLGSLMLARIYLAGMSRENVPEHERKPFYVYVDEAYRFVCTTGDTIVPLPDGRLKRIDEIFNSQDSSVLCIDRDLKLSSGTIECKYKLEADCLRVIAENNWSIGLSRNTPLLVLRNGKPTWVSAKGLKIGDYVAIVSKLNNVVQPAKMNATSLYAAGQIAACGCKLKRSKSPHFDIMPCVGQEIRRIREKYGIPREDVGFIARQEQDLSNMRRENVEKVIGVFERRGVSSEDLANLRTLVDADVSWVKVKRVEDIGRQTVYDLSVPIHHNFIGNGFVVHNSDSIRDILQSLRKYRVYMTLASQYLGQYTEEIARSIPHLCDTIICFSAGEETARALEEFYRPSLTHQDLLRLPKHVFAASALIGGRRECQVLRSIDYGWGKQNVEELIKHSLENAGEIVDMSKYTGVPAVGELPHPTRDGLTEPLMWVVLLKLYRLYEEKRGAGSIPSIEHNDLLEALRQEFNVQPVEVQAALNALASKGYIKDDRKEWDHYGISVPVEPNFQPEPYPCKRCEKLTHRPFILNDGKAICKLCLENDLYYRKTALRDVVEPYLDPAVMHARRIVSRRVTRHYYSITPSALHRFFEQVPRGASGGRTEHAAAIGAIVRMLLRDYHFVYVDTGEEAPRRTENGKVEYERKRRPDIIAWPLTREKDKRINPRFWDNPHAFTVEVEIDPVKHQERVRQNLEKNREWGKPVVFATTTHEWANALKNLLTVRFNQQYSEDCTGFFGGLHDPTKVSVLYIEPETGAYSFLPREGYMATEPAEEAVEEGEEAKTEPAQAQHRETEAGEQVEGKPEEKAGGTVEAEKPEELSVTVKAEDVRHFYSVFSREPWHLYKRMSGDQLLLVAKAKTAGGYVTAILGPYSQHRERLKLFSDIEPPLEPTGEAAEPPKEPGEKPEPGAPQAQPLETTQPVSPEKPTEESPEEKLRRCVAEQWQIMLKKRGKRFALYAKKWNPAKKDNDYCYIGMLNENLQKLAESLGVKLKSRKSNSGDNAS